MDTTLSPIDEVARIPSPCPAPQSLAFDGRALWVGSWETGRVYGFDAHSGRAVEEGIVPGKPVGCVAVGDELWFVCSETDDHRFLRHYVPGHGFKNQAIPLPEDTGSFLAFDGDHLWLSQRYNKRVLQLNGAFAPVREIAIGEEIIGISWVDGYLYASTWWGRDRGGCRIARLHMNRSEPHLEWVAQSPFVAVSLARDGDRLWTNDFKKNEIAAFAIPR
ncbi:MAG: hypothetical protein KGM44_11975 [bacterium]|nr:hypothetical protein [bacterium]